MRLVILGPPGAGKGTQAKLLSQHYKIMHIATGDLLRQAIEERTELGEKVATYLKRGYLVPDDIIMELIKEVFKKELNSLKIGFVLDGIPRTLAQAKALDLLLEEFEANLEYALYINLKEEEILRRIGGRRVCIKCGSNYHIIFSPPKKENLCDICNVPLIQRQDDTEVAIKARFKEYNEKTLPCLEYYSSLGILRQVDGEGKIEDVFNRLISVIKPNI
jgi:adenylate kinase